MRQAFARDRILGIALLISLAWHLVSIMAVKVVAVAPSAGAIKYSRVSFLGPLLGRNPLEVRIGAADRSIRERRYLDMVDASMGAVPSLLNDVSASRAQQVMYGRALDRRLDVLVKELHAAGKVEPSNDE